MTKKNTPERFEIAFEDVPSRVWKLFTEPKRDLAGHVKRVARTEHVAISSSLNEYVGHYGKGVEPDQPA